MASRGHRPLRTCTSPSRPGRPPGAEVTTAHASGVDPRPTAPARCRPPPSRGGHGPRGLGRHPRRDARRTSPRCGGRRRSCCRCSSCRSCCSSCCRSRSASPPAAADRAGPPQRPERSCPEDLARPILACPAQQLIIAGDGLPAGAAVPDRPADGGRRAGRRRVRRREGAPDARGPAAPADHRARPVPGQGARRVRCRRSRSPGSGSSSSPSSPTASAGPSMHRDLRAHGAVAGR